MSTEPLLQITGLQRHYEMAAGTVKALDGVDISIDSGERVILLGPSGSGKTTLLNCIAALDTPTSGTYLFENESVPREHSEQMTDFRRANIGYVFQFFNLLQDLTVLENILLIQELAGQRDEARAEIIQWLGWKLRSIDFHPKSVADNSNEWPLHGAWPNDPNSCWVMS